MHKTFIFLVIGCLIFKLGTASGFGYSVGNTEGLKHLSEEESPNTEISWIPSNDFLPEGFQVTTITSSTTTIYAAGNTNDPTNRFIGLFSSTDGITWTEVNTGLQNYAFFYSLYELDGILYASVADQNIIPELLKSEDGGLTWSLSQDGILTNSTTSYIISDDEGALYAATFTVEDNNSTPRLYKSTNQAESWVELNVTGFTPSEDALFRSMDHTGSEFIISYANSETSMVELYTSEDALVWTRLNNIPEDFFALDISVDTSGVWYVSGIDFDTLDGEMIVSENEGETWEFLPTDDLEEFNHWLLALEAFGDQIILTGSLEDFTEQSQVFFSVPAKQEQSITFEPLSPVTYGDESFAFEAIASSGLPVSYTSSDDLVVSILDGIATIENAGTAMITAVQEGNESFGPAKEVTQLLTINKAGLAVSVEDVERNSGEENPEFKLVYEGFVNDEDVSVIDFLPEVSTSATISSEPGTFDLIISGGEDNNYVFSYSNGTLTILEPVVTGTNGFLSNDISIYPNPVFGVVTILSTESTNSNKTVTVFDSFGNQIFEKSLRTEMQIDFGTHPSGLYLLKIQMEDKVDIFRVFKN
ncbi:MAG: MBG domain-containing protein [Bacteroidota bacterium]